MNERLSATNRLNGWKAIGLYFGRDRTTVMRWARSRGMPVHRLPGGTKSTVFALRDELDLWARGQGDLDDETGEIAEGAEQGAAPPRNGRWLWLAGGLGALLVLAVILLVPRDTISNEPLLPSDPQAVNLYLRARDDWAARNPASLRRAIALFTQVTQREPGFAPAWSGLADAYILSQEFGGMPIEVAYSKAREAADKALILDPGLASAHRARGFVHYWWDKDPRRAGISMRRALALAPHDAQTHFWYGNILSDNGQHALALRELNTARLIEPGSVAIQSDFAFALWASGEDARARATLNQLARTNPDFPGAHDCLSVFKLADGDYAGYVQELVDYARTSDDKDLMTFALGLREALKQGASTVHGRLIDRALGEIASGRRKSYVWPVFLASVAQNRQQVVEFLTLADKRREIWGQAGIVTRAANLWLGDAQVQELLRRRSPPHVA